MARNLDRLEYFHAQKTKIFVTENVRKFIPSRKLVCGRSIDSGLGSRTSDRYFVLVI